MSAPSSLFVLHVTSPVGTIQLTSTENQLFRACFLENGPETDSPVIPVCLQEAATQLEEYFAGKRHTFDLPLYTQGTPFQQQVWQALQQIPLGKTDHYLGLAKRMNNAGAVRAVGVANGANPWMILVPCHRVVGAQGQLTGYAGGLWRKQWLLEHEAKMSGTYQTALF
ncbi:methylated-DNA--[protein]-cysteine S-methyltransferase [Rufibacter hautae]|uniref:Methylated-DNA--protein-cysteine methyltransferase n=1 Tax=Rufibacter hautae TaxID=2595005 RepID=A0A5B6TL50_9BACT|nr:methylated-DNA--[protein]-cysteine S-methyltransferase [Rufibacter hautae]KAA3440125.1 methylated-DNA--[protein]-cysteine S-methyltransferase [Rufibacter hautae]